jgi:hypothetical protein
MKRSKNHTRSVVYEKAVHNLLKMRPFNPSTGSRRTGWLRLLVERRSWVEIVSLRVITRRKFCNIGGKIKTRLPRCARNCRCQVIRGQKMMRGTGLKVETAPDRCLP